MASELSLNHKKKLVLAFDSSTALCTVALGTESSLCGEINVFSPQAHLEKLFPLIERVLEENRILPSELKAIVVGLGPGSFTGLRIGVSTARALAQFLPAKIVGVPSLDGLAYQFLGWNKLICPVVEAKRGEVYAAVYSPLKKLDRLTDYMVLNPDSLVDFLNSSFKNKSLVLTGDGLESYGSFFQSKLANVYLASRSHWYPYAAYLLFLGLAKLKKGEEDNLFSLTPLYLRLSQAEEVYRKRKLGQEKRRRLTLAPMDFRHLDEVLDIEKKSFPTPWTRSMFIQGISRGKGACYLVALMDKKVVGYAGLEFAGREGHITNMAVDPEYRREGIATRLLLRLFELALSRGAKKLVLEVRESNLAARKLYQRFGFKKVGVEKNYYSDTKENALILSTGDIQGAKYRRLLVDFRRNLDLRSSRG